MKVRRTNVSEQKKSRVEQRKARAQQHKKPKTPFKKWMKRILLAIVTIGLVGLISGGAVFAYYASSAPELDEELLKDPLSSEFYDKNGEIFATIGAENRQYVKYEDIPQGMIDAILATEDVRFFEHGGIDFLRLGSAVIANFRDGFGSQGASTITQQVIKNSFLENEKSLKRKAQEAWLAIQLERKYDKKEIFEMYFNKVLMSGRIYGFGTAAQYFYGKDLKDLKLDEMALLAGMPQSPNNYNPLKNPDLAEKRRNIVLGLMEQHGKITSQQAADAKQVAVTEGLTSEEERQSFAGTKYDAFLDVVISEIEENGDGASIAEGIKVYTTLDPNAQEIVENIMNDDNNFPTEDIQAGVAVVDTKTGEIQAIGGGRNYGAERGYNYAEDMKTRSPGSTIKPLLDYGPAIENLQWSTGETTVDEKTTYSNSNQVISNWDGKYLGKMTIREALYTSRNVPAVKTLDEVGKDNAEKFINKLGVETDGLYESDAIGGGKIKMTPVQMAASYAAFGNNGVYNDPHAVEKIIYRDGKSSKTYKKDSVVAMSDSTAYMITDILRDVVSSKPNASGTSANVSGLDIAGKTGTTNYSDDDFNKFNLPDESVPDAWFAGYTTNYSIAIWSGYSEYSEPITTWDERRLPQYLFKDIMSNLSEDIDTPNFKKPSSVVEATIEVGTKPLQLASKYTPDDLRQTELFVRGTEPTGVSEKYNKLELNAPSNVSANYDDASQSIALSWDYTPPTQEGEEKPINVSFEVSMSVDGGASTVVTVTDKNSVIIPITQDGNEYTLSVVATYEDTRSEPGSATVYVDNNSEPEPTTPDLPDVIDPTQPNEEDNTGNDNNNGNTNGNDTNTGDKDNGGTPTPSPSPSPSPTPPTNKPNNTTGQ